MTQTTKGKVEAVNDRSDEDWYGVLIDGDWYNGNDSLDEDIEEGDIVAIKYSEEQNADSSWKSIENIKRTGGTSPNSGSKAGGASNSSSKNGLSDCQASIHAQTATKLAVEHADEEYNDDVSDYLDEVSERAQAYNNIMNQLYGENKE